MKKLILIILITTVFNACVIETSQISDNDIDATVEARVEQRLSETNTDKDNDEQMFDSIEPEPVVAPNPDLPIKEEEKGEYQGEYNQTNFNNENPNPKPESEMSIEELYIDHCIKTKFREIQRGFSGLRYSFWDYEDLLLPCSCIFENRTEKGFPDEIIYKIEVTKDIDDLTKSELDNFMSSFNTTNAKGEYYFGKHITYDDINCFKGKSATISNGYSGDKFIKEDSSYKIDDIFLDYFVKKVLQSPSHKKEIEDFFDGEYQRKSNKQTTVDWYNCINQKYSEPDNAWRKKFEETYGFNIFRIWDITKGNHEKGGVFPNTMTIGEINEFKEDVSITSVECLLIHDLDRFKN